MGARCLYYTSLGWLFKMAFEPPNHPLVFGPSLWTHFDNVGPRTTNLAEGWHNSLKSRFGMPHPSMRNFLHWLQQCQYEVQCRALQLEAGRTPKPRSPTYVKLDVDIADAKAKYGLAIGRIFVNNFAPLSDITWTSFKIETMNYLNHASYLIVGGDST